jgi:hypothetical protein
MAIAAGDGKGMREGYVGDANRDSSGDMDCFLFGEATRYADEGFTACVGRFGDG